MTNACHSGLTVPAVPSVWPDQEPALPPGASVNADGSVSLVLSCPVTIPAGPRSTERADAQQIEKLVFRRMSGEALRKAQSAKSPVSLAMAKMLGMIPVTFERLKAAINDQDYAAAIEVATSLIGDAVHIPERAMTLPDGSVMLPLLYPVSDGQTVHYSLQFYPLLQQQLASLPRPGHDKFMAFALHHATKLPLRVASVAADRMDAVDHASAEAILGELIERVQSKHTLPRRSA
jgi:hypothetical protein